MQENSVFRRLIQAGFRERADLQTAEICSFPDALFTSPVLPDHKNCYEQRCKHPDSGLNHNFFQFPIFPFYTVFNLLIIHFSFTSCKCSNYARRFPRAAVQLPLPVSLDIASGILSIRNHNALNNRLLTCGDGTVVVNRLCILRNLLGNLHSFRNSAESGIAAIQKSCVSDSNEEL